MAQQKFIPGIYNYCDRWCERCTFTSRCDNYESTSALSPEQLDIDNKAFWDTISASFSKTVELLHKAAKERGIDLDRDMTKDEADEFERKERLLRRATQRHSLTRLCKKYEKIATPFLRENGGMDDKARELVWQFEIGVTSEAEVMHTVATIKNCLEIIQWNLLFIDAKLQRALRGKLDGVEDELGFPKDSDGSAKVAIISMERSMGAWMKIYELMFSSEDVALNALSILSQVKQVALQEFPNAMSFKRPGFDD